MLELIVLLFAQVTTLQSELDSENQQWIQFYVSLLMLRDAIDEYPYISEEGTQLLKKVDEEFKLAVNSLPYLEILKYHPDIVSIRSRKPDVYWSYNSPSPEESMLEAINLWKESRKDIN